MRKIEITISTAVIITSIILLYSVLIKKDGIPITLALINVLLVMFCVYLNDIVTIYKEYIDRKKNSNISIVGYYFKIIKNVVMLKLQNKVIRRFAIAYAMVIIIFVLSIIFDKYYLEIVSEDTVLYIVLCSLFMLHILTFAGICYIALKNNRNIVFGLSLIALIFVSVILIGVLIFLGG